MPGKVVSNPFEALFNNVTVGIIVVDAPGKIIMINGFALSMLGYKERELLGKKLEIIIPPEYRKKHKQHHKEYYKSPENRIMERGLNLFAYHKNKKKIPISVSLGYYEIDRNGYAIAVITDISEKIEREEELKELAIELEHKVELRTEQLKKTVGQLEKKIRDINIKDQALQQTNHFLENLLRFAGSIIIATDPKGMITVFNPAAEKHLGYTAAEVVNKKNVTLFHCPEETKQRARLLSAELNKRIAPGFDTYVAKARNHITEETEWTYIRKNKTRFPVSITISALHDKGNRITGFLALAIDISERKKTTEGLKAALEKEKQLGELKSRFVSVASHEFRTPLSTILSSVYLLSKYTTTEEQPKRERHIERIDASIKLLNDMLNDFLSIGRIEEGRVQARISVFNIRNEVESAVEEMKSLLKEKQRFTYTHTGEPSFSLDPALLKHIILNLLSNAIKFSPENSRIQIKTAIKKQELTLSVKDEGIGIPRDDQRHLYERFFRAANAENIKGTGLGLHIVARYAELMKGSVHCNSRLGKGTEFLLSFKSLEDDEINTADRRQ